MIYAIWQLPVNHKNCFKGTHFNLEPIKLKDYVRVYEGQVSSNDLEDIYAQLNIDHPRDYHARSLSVSDIVCKLEGDNLENRTWYYVDSFGFKQLNEEDIK